MNLGLAMDALDARAVVSAGDQVPCECECALAPWIEGGVPELADAQVTVH